jgi:hypothetical protein
VPRQPIRKSDVETLESMERGQTTGTYYEEEVLERLVKLGMLEERKKGVLSLTVRAKTYLLRRKSVKRGRKPKKDPGPAGSVSSS